MKITEYLETTEERKRKIQGLALATCSTEVTVRRWLSGESEPSAMKKEIIAEHLGRPIAELWPGTESNPLNR